ncbi:D-aminoacyl-tRNA deacylase [Glaciecola siphonariae]|uniref:D-aminoacyl-tRNA deacylase n=1 Tax=Glaciecola siphonariae TaxID=521012 RepID=A0ABV9LX60_9ALTE
MIGLIQRVAGASVTVGNKTVGQIDKGILLLLGIEKEDGSNEVEKLARKVMNYRIFADEQGKMNLSLLDVGAKLLVVSQFTLVAQTDKGNRPGFSLGASPEHGERIYNQFVQHVREQYGHCETGIFGADMQVALVNDGPVTFQFKV